MYSFRFNVVENVTRVAGNIGRSFGSAGRAALGFARDVNKSEKAVERLGQRFEGTIGIFRRLAGMAALIGAGALVKEAGMYSDRLYTAHALVAGITRSYTGLTEAQTTANSLSGRLGISYLQSIEGLSKMLTLTRGNVQEAGNLTKLAHALAATNPAEGFDGALFALKEIESGDTLSLRERFNIRVPTQEEAKKIAAKDGRTIQEVMIDSLKEYLDKTYGGGGKGEGVEFLLNIKANTVTGQVQRITNAFASMFTPTLVGLSKEFTSSLKSIADWVLVNQDRIKNWASGLGMIAVRAGTVYGIFLAWRTLTGVWTALSVGIGILNANLYRTAFYAAWGVGQFRALAIAAGTWVYNAVIGAGQAVRQMGLYIASLWGARGVQIQLYTSFAWARIVTSFAAMRLAAMQYLTTLSWANIQTRLLAGIGAARTAVMAFAATAVPAILSYAAGLNFATIGQSILNIVMLANPIGLIIAGVAALVAAFYGLYKLTDWLFPGFFKSITEWFGKAWDWVYKNFIEPLVGFFKWLGDITGISSAFSGNATAEQDTSASDRALADQQSLMASLGINPNAPGVSTGGKNGGFGVAKALDANVQGDRSIKNFTINIQKQVENMVFNTVKDLSDIPSAVKREVERVMLDAVNEVNYSN